MANINLLNSALNLKAFRDAKKAAVKIDEIKETISEQHSAIQQASDTLKELSIMHDELKAQLTTLIVERRIDKLARIDEIKELQDMWRRDIE